VELLEKTPNMMKLFQGWYQLSLKERENPAINTWYVYIKEWMSRWVKRGQELGEIRNDLPHALVLELSYGIGEAFDRWSLEHLDEMMSNPEEMKRIGELQLKIFKEVLSPKKGDG
jgi:hypothetical protein